MVEAVDSGHLDSAITPPRKKRMLGKLITAKALGIAGVIALTGGAAAAATGTLPDPVQDKASNVADVVGINIPNGDHGSQVAPVARDKDGDEEGQNHGERVRETARDNHGHEGDSSDDDTTSTTVEDRAPNPNRGPGNNNAGGNGNGRGRDHAEDDEPATTTTTVSGTTPTTVDDHGGQSGKSGKGKGGANDDAADHANDDHGSGGHGADD